MKKITQKISEKDTWVEGGFHSEQSMSDDLNLSAYPGLSGTAVISYM